MGEFFQKFRMDWCLIWNSVYDGSIASAIYMMVASLIYIGICVTIICYAYYFSGPGGITLGNEYREIIRHADLLFTNGHAEISDESGEQGIHSFAEARAWLRKKTISGELAALQTSSMPNWLQNMMYFEARRIRSQENEEEGDGDGHDTEEPLLTETDRDILVNPTIAMLAFSSANIIFSALLLTAILKRNVMYMLLWSVIILPLAALADNAYQIFLFYVLLTMGQLWAHTGTIQFEILVVVNFIMWIMRNLYNLYTFFCITAYRNASTQRRRTNDRRPIRQRLELGLSSSLAATTKHLATTLRSYDYPTSVTTTIIEEENDFDDAASIASEEDNVVSAKTTPTKQQLGSMSSSDFEQQQHYFGNADQPVDTVTLVLYKNGLLRQPSVSSQAERHRLLTESTLKIINESPSFF